MWSLARTTRGRGENRPLRLSAIGKVALSIELISSTAVAVCVDGRPSVASEYRTSRSVVIGTVIGEQSLPKTEDDYFRDGTLYRVKTTKILRGAIAPTMGIFSENSSGRFPMDLGHEYLSFVYAEDGRLRADNCGNSGLLSRSSRILQQVQKLIKEQRD
jgi:hypothetical protein